MAPFACWPHIHYGYALAALAGGFLLALLFFGLLYCFRQSSQQEIIAEAMASREPWQKIFCEYDGGLIILRLVPDLDLLAAKLGLPAAQLRAALENLPAPGPPPRRFDDAADLDILRQQERR